jgi:AraC family transcriptional regulator, activator of mtrCDE
MAQPFILRGLSTCATSQNVQDDISTFDRLIDAMQVRISAFALLNISPEYRLCFNGSAAPVVHFVLTGQGVFEFPDKPALFVTAGDVVVLPPACPKTLRTGDGPYRDVRSGDRCQMDLSGLIRIDAGSKAATLTVLCGSMGSGVVGMHGLFDRLAHPLRDNLKDVPIAAEAFALLRSEVKAPDFGTHALAGALMKVCLALVIRRRLDELLALHGFTQDIVQKRLRRAIFHVFEQPGAAHSVATLGKVAGMSRTNFARTFIAAFGSSPMTFVQKVRLHHAAELLTTTDLPVKMIAASTGLSRSHFSRAFHVAFGQDPASFRLLRINRSMSDFPVDADP